MAKKFGTTWWGEQWLNSLAHIDYGNRLPRGARYARNGYVRSIEIKKGCISARVAGSRPTPYKEIIEVSQFDKTKINDFVDKLTSHPIILASLMQRRLDSEVLQIAQESGLQVFPTSWKDLEMKCSCPDWAIPCKHLAAVIYKVSEEIDNNPFLVFELHGLDLLEELKKRGMLTTEAAKSLDPVSIEELIKTTHSSSNEEAVWTIPYPDFSKLPSISNELLELLTDDPPFSIEGNFKKEYVKYLSTISKSATKTLNTVFGREESYANFEPETDIAFNITPKYKTEIKLISPDKKTKVIPFEEFIERLSGVSPESFLTSLPWLEVLHKMWLLAANLLSRQDVIPRIVSVGKDYRIIWQPAILHTEIRAIVNNITKSIPQTTVVFKGKCVENGGDWLLCNMLNTMISQIGRNIRHDFTPLFRIFFLDEPQCFDAIGQGGIAGGISVWTDKFFMLHDNCEFALHIEEKRTKFTVSLFIAPTVPQGALKRHTPFTDFIDNTDFQQQKLEVMTKLTALIDYMPGLRDYIIGYGRNPMTFDSHSFVSFLFKTLPLMRLLGLDIALPKSLREIVTPKVSMKIDRKDVGNTKSYVRIDELLTFDWEISLGDTSVSIEEFQEMMHHAGELVKFKGRYIYATPEELERISKQLAKGGKMTPQEILAVALAENYKDAPVTITSACRELLDKFRQLPPLPAPNGLQANLRPYQLRGYEWMVHNLSLGFGAIIADDMGLGKTIQVIAVLLHLKENNRLDKHKALVVAPTGLLTNWQQECARFAPALTVCVYHGTMRNIDKFDADVLLTSYGIVRSDVDKLKKQKWELLVIDEAQNIKNTTTTQTKAINSITASAHIAMSGTPVENRLSEYWSIMNFANKGLLGSLKEFNTQYGRPIQIEGNKDAAERFKATTAPFMMRRLKSDKSIISDLPDKTERDEYALLTTEQTALYQQTLNEAMREIESMGGQDKESLFKREGLVLQMIMALKQICNHPAQFLKTKQDDAELSGKTMMLIDLIKSIVSNGEKVLVFTQFKEMGDLIVTMLDKANIASMFYHGGCTLKKRTEMVEHFQNQRSPQVFVLTLKAAGTGLNLTAATNVIHFDLWWNPAVEAQATDRAYRIGQHRNVQVYRFITKGTFEEKINAIIQDKKQLAELTVGTGEKWISSMSDAELRSIFTLDS